MIRALILTTFCLTSPALADISSTRPMPRPSALAEANAPLVEAAIPETSPARSIRPIPRPEITEGATRAPGRGRLGKLFGSKKAVAVKPAPNANGSVCGDPAIRGTAIADIKGAQKGCGVDNPVRVTSVDGVTLSTPATLDCTTARALREWVTAAVKPAFGANGITGMRVAADYACRGRNNKKGARVSEHGRGKAIDIAGFTLANGGEVSVLKHYKSRQGKAIRGAHKGACGIFGTTLGPGSDGHHQDHLHLDTASYRGGPYCK